MKTHLWMRGTNIKEKVKARSQLEQKNGREGNKPGFPCRKRKAWQPPGVGSSTGANDTYKKAP